ncbi:MAG: hypothetical protein ABFS12_03385 [Bacteroidota bacterium]
MKKNDSQLKVKKKRSKVLLTLTTIYAILYAILLLSFLLFEDYTFKITLEGIIIILAVIIFFIGYYYSWRNERIAGTIFIFWWGIMWYVGLFVAETDRGAGVVMGVPMFIIGILFIVSNYRKKLKSSI